MEIATSSKEKITYKKHNPEVIRFINECNVERGGTRVMTYMIYYRYYRWKTNKRNMVSRTAFFLEFAKHFDRKRVGDGRVYLVNPEPFDLSTEGFFAARALLRRERDVRKQKKEKDKKK